jgi:hypothetical protein
VVLHPHPMLWRRRHACDKLGGARGFVIRAEQSKAPLFAGLPRSAFVRSRLYGRIYGAQSKRGLKIAKHLSEPLGNTVLGVMAHLERCFRKHPDMTWTN